MYCKNAQQSYASVDMVIHWYFILSTFDTVRKPKICYVVNFDIGRRSGADKLGREEVKLQAAPKGKPVSLATVCIT